MDHALQTIDHHRAYGLLSIVYRPSSVPTLSPFVNRSNLTYTGSKRYKLNVTGFKLNVAGCRLQVTG